MTLTECARVPLTVIVRVNDVPATAVGLMETCIEGLTDPPAVVIVAGLGTNITISPDGTELLVSVTSPVKEPRLVTVMMSWPVPPNGMERDFDAAVMLKSLTVNGSQALITALLLRSPL